MYEFSSIILEAYQINISTHYYLLYKSISKFYENKEKYICSYKHFKLAKICAYFQNKSSG